MNLLELKLVVDDAFAKVSETAYDVHYWESAGLVNNQIVDGEPSPELHGRADLVFHSIGEGELPNGGSFVLIECKRSAKINTPWKELLSSLDRVMDKVPLNAPVIFIYENKPIFLWCLFSSIGLSGNPDKEEHFARLLFQFMDYQSPKYEKVFENLYIELGVPRPIKGQRDLRGRLF
jgi:hypothetical protein